MQNRHNFQRWILLLFFLFLSLFACRKKGQKETDIMGAETLEKRLLVVTIAPYKYLLSEIIGAAQDIEIWNTSESSADPHTVDLTPQQAVRLKKATVFLSIQPEEERLLLRSLGEATQIIEMWHEFPLLAAQHHHEEMHHEDEHSEEGHGEVDHGEEAHGEEEHSEDERKEHLKAGWDEHFWLSPTALKVQIETMGREMAELFPQRKNEIEANTQALLKRCDTLAASLRSSLPALQNGKILSFHSALAYFADFFNAQEIFIESKGVELGSEEMLHLSEEVQDLSYPVFIYQPQFEQEKAKILARQLDLQLIEFDPQREDVFANLLGLAEDLAQNAN